MVGLLAIVYLQSGWLFRDFNPTIPQALFYPETDAIRTLKAQISDGGQVLLRQGTLLLPNSNLPFRLSTTSLDGGGIESRYYYQLKVSLFGNNAPLNDAEHFDETSLRLFGVQAIATDDVQHLDQYASNPAYRVLARQPSYAILRYLNALPAFHVTYNALVAASDQQVLSLLKAPGFDPASQVILSAPADLSSLTAPVGQVSSSAETLRVLVDEPTRTVIDLSNHSQPGFLVLDKTFYPGWKASVDGRQQPCLAPAVALPPEP